MIITIAGRIPSKKNSKQIVRRGNRSFLISSNEYYQWHRDASLQLPRLKQPLKPKLMTLTFYPPDRRRADLSNKAESVMDLLVDNKIIIDDNWFEIAELHLVRKEIDRLNPRVTVYLEE